MKKFLFDVGTTDEEHGAAWLSTDDHVLEWSGADGGLRIFDEVRDFLLGNDVEGGRKLPADVCPTASSHQQPHNAEDDDHEAVLSP